ncbi:MAG: hypothetical protein KGD65_12830 [Candidatus Lokiarchaeota archaeon]|nr:hypothetical protein [Candidatus Lokiarchaeota archaeon]
MIIARRIYVKGKKTHAKGETFSQDNVGEEKERFLISLDLMSLKTRKDYDSFGRVGEFYFKIDGPKTFKARFPNKGVIKLQKNQTFTSKADLSLWSQFKTVHRNEEVVEHIKVIIREMDHMKKDQTVAEQDIEIKLPQQTQYLVVQDAHEEIKAKLRVQATRTRY